MVVIVVTAVIVMTFTLLRMTAARGARRCLLMRRLGMLGTREGRVRLSGLLMLRLREIVLGARKIVRLRFRPREMLRLSRGAADIVLLCEMLGAGLRGESCECGQQGQKFDAGDRAEKPLNRCLAIIPDREVIQVISGAESRTDTRDDYRANILITIR